MEIPQEFDNKTKEELYGDIVMLSHYVTKLKGEIENVQAILGI
jgi:hypothetical protein